MAQDIKYFIEQCQDVRTEQKFDHNFLGIQLTSSCPMECEHCIFSCQKNGEDIPLPLLFKIIREWRNMQNSTGVSLTGGEPFYRMELLLTSVKFAQSLGLTTRVVTSAFWAKSYNHAIDCLTNLQGLSEIFISIDRFHQKNVPVNYAINAFNAANYLGIKAYFVVSSDENNPEKDLEPFSEYLGNTIQPKDVRLFGILNFGRARFLKLEQTRLLTDSQVLIACNGMNVPFVNIKGQLFYCCVPSATGIYPKLLSRGSVADKSLAFLLDDDVEDYWLIQALRAGGPDLLARSIGYCWPDSISKLSVCDRCLHFFNTPKLYELARSVVQKQDFRETVSILLYNRGDIQPLTRFFCEEIGEET